MFDSFGTPWTVAHQAPLSMGFSRQEYWSGLPFPTPGDLSDPGIKSASPALAGGFLTAEPPGTPDIHLYRDPISAVIVIITKAIFCHLCHQYSHGLDSFPASGRRLSVTFVPCLMQDHKVKCCY